MICCALPFSRVSQGFRFFTIVYDHFGATALKLGGGCLHFEKPRWLDADREKRGIETCQKKWDRTARRKGAGWPDLWGARQGLQRCQLAWTETAGYRKAKPDFHLSGCNDLGAPSRKEGVPKFSTMPTYTYDRFVAVSGGIQGRHIYAESSARIQGLESSGSLLFIDYFPKLLPST